MDGHAEIWISVFAVVLSIVVFLVGIMFKMGWSIVEELRRTNERQDTRLNALSVSVAKTEESFKAIIARFDRLEKYLDSKRGG